VTVRDSAGVEILTYPGGEFADTVREAPVLSIGREGEPDYEFFRIHDVVGLASGGLVVANGGTHELRFYGPDGTHLRTVGDRGDGPEEFGFLSQLRLRTGDTLMVIDTSRRRLVFFDSAGTLIRGESFSQDLTNESPGGSGVCFMPSLVGAFRNGARVTLGWGCLDLRGGEGRRPLRQPIELVAGDGRMVLGTDIAGWIWETGETEDPRNLFAQIPFGGLLRFVAGADRVFLSRGQRYEIEVYDDQGNLIRLLREDAVPPEVTDADRDAYVRERAETPRPHPEGVPFAERFGSYITLLLTPEGDLWARRVARPGEEAQHWVVFPADGGSLRSLVLPDVSVESVRNGKIYATLTDSLGIQTVVVLDAG
jgi:hypothetical protein